MEKRERTWRFAVFCGVFNGTGAEGCPFIHLGFSLVDVSVHEKMNPIGLVKTTILLTALSKSSEKCRVDVALPLSLLPEPMQEKKAS